MQDVESKNKGKYALILMRKMCICSFTPKNFELLIVWRYMHLVNIYIMMHYI